MTRFWLTVATSATLLLLVGAPAQAQWETPNRAFHNGTGFPLDGRHQTVPCQSCHLNGVYKGTPTTCFDCHWIRRQDDRYQTRLGLRCEVCHTTTNWLPARWNHQADAGVPLNPVHMLLACDTCHRDARFETPSLDCASCHMEDYRETREPNHAAAGFPTNCETCHRPSDASFEQAVFDHNAYFPLIGVHATQACAVCHENSVYQGTPTDCVGCHRDDYDRTQSPNHAAAGFPTACESCHRPVDTSWSSGTGFDHNGVFPLVGVHATQACAVCHQNNVFRGTPTDCVGCHRDDYDRTQAPNHAAAGFPTACESCHRPTDASWSSGTGFDHNSVFPLVGVHATQACAVCHQNNVYKGTPRDCVGCHRDDYDRTRNPNHAAAGFPTACESCHRSTDASWSSGDGFNHNNFFPLVGVHATQACAVCHQNNVYDGTPRDCVGCHRDDYDRTRDPNHAASGFPTACDSCHRNTDTSWDQGRFVHAWFPITSGPHANRPCSACHTNTASYAVFTCLTCHERSETDREHREENGYRYDSPACYACHPNGKH